MNKICCVCYGADDKNSVKYTDYKLLRVIECKSKFKSVSFLAKRKIRRYSRGFSCFDFNKIAKNIVEINPKALFSRDIHRCVQDYGRVYGIDLSCCELAVAGKISFDSLKELCTAFKMVWTTEDFDCDIYNLYTVKNSLPKTEFAIFADKGISIPNTDVLFNLTEEGFNGINNIEISTDLPCCLPDIYRLELVKNLGLDYKIINFVK